PASNEHRAYSGKDAHFQPQPPCRLLSAEPCEDARERNAETNAAVDPCAQAWSLMPSQLGQRPATRTHQRPSAKDACQTTQQDSDGGPRLSSNSRRSQCRHGNTDESHLQT